MNITEDMTIAKVLEMNRKTAEVFAKYGMHCMGCAVAAGETVAQAAQAYGLDVKKLVEELSEVPSEVSEESGEESSGKMKGN